MKKRNGCIQGDPDPPQGICWKDVPNLRELGDQELARNGLINVTAAPFDADPRGNADSTAAIQAAVTFGRRHKLAVFFPAGTYLISESISCAAGWTEEETRFRRYLPHSEYWPCVLIGERSGEGRPRIVLAEHAPGFSDPDNPGRCWIFSRGTGRAPTMARLRLRVGRITSISTKF